MRRTGRFRRSGRTWRHWRLRMTRRHGRSRSGRTAAMVRRLALTVIKLHKNKRHAVCLTAAAANTPCLCSWRSAGAACYSYCIFTLGGHCQYNGASTCHLARGNKIAASVGDGHVEIIRLKGAGCKIVVNSYRKPAFAACCYAVCRACCRTAVGRSAGAVRCI